MKFYIINRTKANFGETIFDNARYASLYMLGRQMGNYYILKEDENGLRLVPMPESCDVTDLEIVCEIT
jgi:hypothetical protein